MDVKTYLPSPHVPSQAQEMGRYPSELTTQVSTKPTKPSPFLEWPFLLLYPWNF